MEKQAVDQSTVEYVPSALAPSYTTRSYSAGELSAILVLLQQTLGNSGAVRKTEDFWNWKHHANPFGTSYGLCAWDESMAEVAGLRMLMRWLFCDTKGQILRAVRAVDTATHPDHQRRGLFSAMTRQAIAELADQGVDLVFNTPNQNSLPGYLKMGWRVAAQWPLYLKPLRAMRIAYRHLRPVTAATTLNFSANFGPGILPWHDFARRFNGQLMTLLNSWEHNRKQTGLRTQRSVDYFAWRYGGHPHIEYAVYPQTDGQGVLQGFAILRPNVRYGWQETVLAELCLAQPDAKLGGRLLRGLIRQLRSDYLIAHFADNTLEAKVLKDLNFWRVPHQHIIFTVRPLQSMSDDLVKAEVWDLSLGDLELF